MGTRQDGRPAKKPESPKDGRVFFITDIAQATKVARLNDTFRSTLIGGQVILTAGVQALPELTLTEVMKVVQSFDTFTEDNDPYGEHDFGSFKIEGQRFFWKIEYYDPTLTYGSENPADPTKTIRVLTIMLAKEY